MEKTEKLDVRQALTDKLIESLEKGVIPWRKEWKTVGGLPRNATSDRHYTGGNSLSLLMEAADRGYADPRWLTFNQARSLGGAVNQGEHGVRVEYWDKQDFWKRKDVALTNKATGKRLFVDGSRRIEGGMVPVKGAGDGRSAVAQDMVKIEHDGKEYTWKQAEAQLSTVFSKSFVVFNVEQCDGLDIKPLAEVKEVDGFEKAKAVVAGMEANGVKINHPSDRAFYRPGADTVYMPAPGQFTSPEAYYGTLLHEIGHATGHPDRLNREYGNKLEEEKYAREELVAELTSVFSQAETGIRFDDENHAAYIGSWLEALKKDKNEIYRAAKEAGKATDYMQERAKEVFVEKDQQRDPEQSLRKMWDEKGIPKEKQDELVAAIEAKAQPGARVGPFVVPEAGLER